MPLSAFGGGSLVSPKKEPPPMWNYVPPPPPPPPDTLRNHRLDYKSHMRQQQREGEREGGTLNQRAQREGDRGVGESVARERRVRRSVGHRI